jgi:hypothetical protein
MKHKTKILVYVDQNRRDLFPMTKIADTLKKDERFEVALSGKLDFLYAVLLFKPHVIIFGKADATHGDWLRAISNCVVISINTEQGFTEAYETVRNFMDGHKYPRPPALDRVDYHFLVSEATRNHLAPHLDKDKLVVVGYTRLMQERFAVEPRKPKENFTVGIACGENVGDEAKIQAYFSNYLDKSFGFMDNVQAFLAYHVLDRGWLNHIAEILKQKYRLIARYRFGDDRYLLREEQIEIDKSLTPKYLFDSCDLIIMGQSTIGVEAMMAGVPVISVIKLVNPGFTFNKLVNWSYYRICWQPETLAELLELVEARREGRLALSPYMAEYRDVVSNTYYNGAEQDFCMRNIYDFVCGLRLKGEARLDLDILFSLLPFTWRPKISLKLCRALNSKMVYKLLVSYLAIRKKFKKSIFQDIYIPNGLPS